MDLDATIGIEKHPPPRITPLSDLDVPLIELPDEHRNTDSTATV
jgi:hypothetical protein